MHGFRKIEPKELEGNVFKMFDTEWALLTAGTPESFNTMTISWGGLGWLWRRPVSFIFVRRDRYTFQFVEQNDCFTVCFFDENECRDQLRLLGTKSGRDSDKMNSSGLTPVWIDGQPAFAEAKAVLVCKKLYSHQFDSAKIPEEIIATCYPNVPPEVLHMVYTSEIIGCYVK